ncbi:unnamed protein product, partial [marine sediment metagenome]
YLSVMENGEITDQSIGKALNISQSGIFCDKFDELFHKFVCVLIQNLGMESIRDNLRVNEPGRQ